VKATLEAVVAEVASGERVQVAGCVKDSLAPFARPFNVLRGSVAPCLADTFPLRCRFGTFAPKARPARQVTWGCPRSELSRAAKITRTSLPVHAQRFVNKRRHATRGLGKLLR